MWCFMISWNKKRMIVPVNHENEHKSSFQMCFPVPVFKMLRQNEVKCWVNNVNILKRIPSWYTQISVVYEFTFLNTDIYQII